jgi:GTPase Era involved in 16S rRNA processing
LERTAPVLIAVLLALLVTFHEEAMPIQNFDDLTHWADQLSVIMRERKRDDITAQIDEAKTALQANVFTLAVLGKAKRGKSTLINALLGRNDDEVAPIDKLPASSAITRFRFAQSERTTVLFKDNHTETIPYSRIREFVTEESNPENKKDVAMLEVSGPFANLPPQVELVDTPGAGSIHEHHDALLHAFIPQADAVIFIVTARMPLDQDELDLLKAVKAADINKIFFVINKIDEAEETDIADAVAHNQKLLAANGITTESFHRISAKQAFQGKPNSGVPELIDTLGQFLQNNKGKILRQRFLSKVNSFIETEVRSLEVAVSSASKTGEELDAEIALLRQRKREVETQRSSSEHHFKSKWTTEVNDFQSKLSIAQRNVEGDLVEKLNSTSSFGVGKLAKILPTLLNESFEKSLHPLTDKFEAETRDACTKLNEAYPALSLDETGKVSITAKGNMTTAIGTVGGLTATAVGGGLVYAGSATAAAIAATNTAALTATSAAAATAVGGAATTASIIGGLGVAADAVSTFLIGMPLGFSLAGGAASAAGGVTVAAPTMLATPFWCALAGPVGWTIAGVGVLAVPFAWRLSKMKQKDKLESAAKEQIEKVFKGIKEDRIPALHKMGETILNDFRHRLDQQITELENSLTDARNNRPSEEVLTTWKRQKETFERLIKQSVEWFTT